MSNKFSLTGKVAIVTGAASGIGKSITKTFSQAGADVHILDVDHDRGAAAAAEIDRARFHSCNMTMQSEVTDCIGRIANEAPIDILVNNAGVGFVGNLEETDEETFDRLLAINVKGVYNGMYAVVPHMKKHLGGVILNVASTVSLSAIPARFAYTTSKGAVLTMTYSVALDYLHDQIRCNAIAPARVHTPFVDDYIAKNYPGREQEMFEHLSASQPIGRMAKPEEIADLALYLCSDEAAFVTGQCYGIDGGFLNLRPSG